MTEVAPGLYAGNEIRINHVTNGWESDQIVMSNGTGFIVVYQSAVADYKTPLKVFGQRYDAAGEPIGSPIQFGGQGADLLGAVGLNGGGLVVLWAEYAAGTTTFRYNVLDVSGAPVATQAVSLGERQGLTALEGGGFAIHDDTGIQRYSATGSEVGSRIVFRSAEEGRFLDEVRLDDDGNGGFYLYWEEQVDIWVDMSTEDDPYAGHWESYRTAVRSRYDASGEEISHSLPNDRGFITPLSNGGLVFAQAVSVSDNGRHRWDAQASIYGADGQLVATFRIPQDSTYNHSPAPAVELADGSIAFAWTAGSAWSPAVGNWVGQDGSSDAVYGRIFSASGEPLSPEYRLNDYVQGSQMLPHLAALPSGGFAVVWQSFGQDGKDWGVVGKVVGTEAPNAAPTEITLSNTAVDENAAGAVIGIVAATDPNGDTLTYTVNDTRFEVEIDDHGVARLKLKDARALDYEAQPGGIPLTITASDGEFSTTKSFTIAINDKGAYIVGTEVGDTIAHWSSPSGQPRPGSENDTLLGNGGGDNLQGSGGNDSISGGAGSDFLSGEDGDDTLNGGTGNDQLRGEAGIDTLVLTGARADYEIVPENGWLRVTDIRPGNPDGSDTVNGVEKFQFSDGVVDVADLGLFVRTGGVNGDNLHGGDGRDRLIGNGGNDTLWGHGGDDIFEPGPGSDTVYGGAGVDTLVLTGARGDYGFEILNGLLQVKDLRAGSPDGVENFHSVERISFSDGTVDIANIGPFVSNGSAAGETARGSYSNDIIIGGGGNDSITADAGDDQLQGDAGNDTLVGGDGIDTLIYSGARADYRIEPAGSGSYYKITDLRAGSPDGTDLVSAEFIRFADGTFAMKDLGPFVLAGTGGRDVLSGGHFGDSISGGEGNDVLGGGEGNDTLLGEGGHDNLNGSIGDDSLVGGIGDDGIFGDVGNDTLVGAAGRDVLVGGLGADWMEGGADNDSYYVDDPDDVVIEAADGGFDSIESSINLTLASNVEQARLVGSAQIATGNDQANSIYGNEIGNILRGNGGNDNLDGSGGNDTLRGGAGDDYLRGGTGSDTAVFTGARSDYRLEPYRGHIMITDLRPGAPDGIDTVLDVELFQFADGTYTLDQLAPIVHVAGSGNDTVYGSYANDSLDGSGGNDTIYGMGGNDTLLGGIGNDSLHGNQLGNDSLDGGQGTDSLYGYGGNDTFRGSSGDVIYGDVGTDRLILSGARSDYELVPTDQFIAFVDLREGSPDGTVQVHGVELIEFSDGAVNINDLGPFLIEGSDWSDYLQGTYANDSIVGNDGDDQIDTSTGDDTIDGGEGVDWTFLDFHSLGQGVTFALTNGAVAETAHGKKMLYNVERAEITGTAYADNITGGSGDDYIRGFGNDDQLDGAGGNDIIYSEGFNANIFGGAGRDQLYGDGGTLNGGEDNDILEGIGSQFYGEGGNDLISALDPLQHTAAHYSGARSDYLIERLSTFEYRVTDLRPDSPDGTDTLSFVSTLVFSDTAIALISPPAAGEDYFTINEDEERTFTPSELLANDVDAQDDPLKIVSVGNAYGGSVKLNDDGTITFTPEMDYFGGAAFSYMISDGAEGYSEAWVYLDILNVNDDPAPGVDYFTATEGDTITYTREQLLGNDTDADGDYLTIAGIGATVGCVAVLNDDGTVTVTLEPTFIGEATFEYLLNDQNGGTGTGYVSITVEPGVDEPLVVTPTVRNGALTDTADRDVFEVIEGSLTASDDDGTEPYTFSLVGGVADTSVSGFNISSGSSFAYGKLYLNSQTGEYRFVPDADAVNALGVGFTAEARFHFQATDGAGKVSASDDEAYFRIVIDGANDTPIGQVTISGTTAVGEVLVASHDLEDAEGVGLVSYEWQRNGVDIPGATQNSYKLSADDVGAQISVKVTYLDTKGSSEMAVSSPIGPVQDGEDNQPPSDIVLTGGAVAENAAADTVVGTVAAVDSDDETFSYELVDDASGLFVIDSATGVIRLAEGASLDFEASQSHDISIRVKDSAGGTFEKLFTISVTDNNEAPVANADEADTDQNSATSIDVLGNDTDPDTADELKIASASIVSGTGKLEISADKLSILYDPNGSYVHLGAGATAEVKVSYTVDDGRGGTATSEVTIAVTGANDAPVALTLDGGSVVEGSAAGTLVAKMKGEDPDQGDKLTYSLVDDSDGLFTIDENTGEVRVAEGAVIDFEEFDSHILTIRVTDSAGETYEESFNVQVQNRNEGPKAADDAFETDQNSPLSLDVLANDSDPDGDDLVITSATASGSGKLTIAPDGKSLSFDTNGEFARLAEGQTETIEISYEISDGQGGTSTAKAIVSVEGVNDAPMDIAFDPPLVEEGTAAGTVIGKARGVDPDSGATLSYSLVDHNAGIFEIDPRTGDIRIAQGAVIDYEAADSYDLTIRVTDELGAAFEKQFKVSIKNVNEGPVAADDVAETGEDDLVAIDVLANDSDPDQDDALTILSAEILGGAGGSVSIAGDGQSLAYDPSGAFDALAKGSSTTVKIAYTVRDLSGAVASAVATVTVKGQNDAPVSIALAGGKVSEGATTGTKVAVAQGSDVDTGDTLTYSLSNNAGGRFSINATTGEIFVAAGHLIDFENASSHEIGIKVTDAAGESYVESFTIEVENGPEVYMGTRSADPWVAPNDDDWRVFGMGGNDSLTSGAGNDTIAGGAGNDMIDAGLGDDFITFTGTLDGHDAVDGGEGHDRIEATQNGTIIGLSSLANVEEIDANGFTGVSIVGTSSANELNFSAVVLNGIERIDLGNGNDSLVGSAGEDVILGGAGNDTLDGYEGNDIFEIGLGAGTDSFIGGEGEDEIRATANGTIIGIRSIEGIEAISGAGFNNVRITTTSAADVLDLTQVMVTGITAIDLGSGNDILLGSEQDDTIIGGAGNDDLSGGGGNDTFLIGTAAGMDIIAGGSGYNRILAAANGITMIVGAVSDIQEINAAGHLGFKLSGTSGADVLDFGNIKLVGVSAIDGGSGNDSITGSSGADSLLGGAGNDTLVGGDGGDTLVGGAGNDSLVGGDAGDLFEIGAGAGADSFIGGAGTDEIRATAAGAVIGIAMLSSIEQISAAGLTGVRIAGTSAAETLDLSAVVLSGISAIDMGSGNDVLIASEGSDTIIAGAGNDELHGGGGNDVFEVGAGAGSDRFFGGNGVDSIVATQSGVAIGIASLSSIENISSRGFANVRVIGTSSADVLDFTGVTLTGIGSIDSGSGNDVVTGSSGNDSLLGGAGNDALSGGGGADTLVGGAGTDFLTGGASDDVFTFTTSADSRSGTSRDVIADFTAGDKIDLSAIDAISGTAGNDAFAFIGTAAFSKVAGQLRYQSSNGITVVEGDTNGDGRADFQIQLNGVVALNQLDFWL